MNLKTVENDLDILRTRSREVDIKRDWNYIKDVILELKGALRELGDKAVGLSAIQLGHPVRVFVINFGNKLQTFINPVINKYSNAYFSTEGCLSIPDKEYLILRYHDIEFFYQTPTGQNQAARLRGLAAQVFQHEIDHLDGLLISDGGVENTEELQKLSGEERIEFFKELADSMDLVSKQLKEESIKELQEEKEKIQKLDDKEETVEIIEEIIDKLQEEVSDEE